MVASAEKSSKGLPTAQEVMEKLALAEAKKAEEESRKHAVAEAEKKQLLDRRTRGVQWVDRGAPGLESL